MKFSMLPFLFVTQIVAIYVAATITRRSGAINTTQSRSIMAVLAMLIVWGAISSFLGLTDWYQSEAFLTSLPGFWITMPAVLIIMVPWMFSATFRETTNAIIDRVPLYYVMAFEGLRVLAIGGILKAYNGEFSALFGTWVGIPDFLFGVAALVAAYLIFTGIWGKRAAIGINLFGFVIIVPFAVVLINLGLPGVMHMVDESPSMISIFEFPMALAPTLVVPIFVTINLLVAIRLMTKQM
jgi:hypothetical protein